MQAIASTTPEPLNFIRAIFALIFVATLLAGGYLALNYEHLFGVDPSFRSESSSEQSYSRMQIFVVWAHIAALTGAFAFLLH